MKKLYFVMITCILLTSNIFLNAQNIPNNSFENWSLIGSILKPVDWTTTDQQFMPISITQYNPGSSGNSAAKITIMDFNGNMYSSLLTTGLHISNKPDSLTAQYIFFIANDDSATFTTAVTYYKDGTPVSGGVYETSTESETYNTLTIHFDYSEITVEPDSASIIIAVTTHNNIPGSYVVVDDINFYYTVGISNRLKSHNLTTEIFPNPAIDFINIPVISSDKSSKINISNITGQLIKSINLTDQTDNIKISVDDLPDGIYFANIFNNDKYLSSKKFIIRK